MECIILAGGLGTRLRSEVADLPKCMAPVNDQPFLQYIFTYLQEQGCTRVILSLGYKWEAVSAWLMQGDWAFDISCVIENEPLGTGGGVVQALEQANEENVVVLNGDTMFRVDLGELLRFHRVKNAATTLALKPMHDFERYGVVNIDSEARIISFEEKKHYQQGLINGGVYTINKREMLTIDWPQKFSLERDYFEKNVRDGNFYGFVSDAYFIDIGIPEDYHRAQEDLKKL